MLLDGFSDDVQLFDSFKEKETETNEEVLAEKKDNQITKKRKSLSQDPLAEAIISMSNARQIIWEKRLASEND
ncbi:4087_t:CDS:2, partial [Rhizophagus irregularis]